MIKKFFVIFFIVFMFGCGGLDPISSIPPIINGIIIWENQTAIKYYDKNYETLNEAVIVCLKNLKIPIKSEKNFDWGKKIICYNDDKFIIQIIKIQDNITKLTVRVNFLGNKEYAELIIKKIDQFLN